MVHDEEPGPSIEVVGVGASAGGLKALTAMLGGFAGDGPAIVIVTHLAPDQQTYLHDILSRRSPIPIGLAEDQEAIERGRGYVIPPGRSMIVSRGRLLLGERDPDESPNLPVDVFFRSLAADFGDRAAAVVLSGTGRDGSRGIQEVHEVGGLVIVQEPDTAEFASMPEASLATGLVDAVVPPEQIADEIEKHASIDANGDSAREAPAVNEVLDRVHRQSGVDFRQYKRTTVLRRLKRRVAILELPDVASYREHLETNLGEVDALYQDLLIGVTRFFRDPEAFDVLQTRLRKLVVERSGDGPPLRIWIPGCATGEEAYTIAAILCDIYRNLERPPDFRVFATDIHPSSLEHASQARYSLEDLEDIPERLRDRWFENNGEALRVVPELRDLVVFARHDLIRDPPFTRVDLVSCRNLLIYFRPETQRRVMTLFHFALRTEGLLFLGPSETTGRLADEFETIDRRWRLYRKKRDVRLHPDFRVHGQPVPTRRRLQGAGELALQALVDAYAPPTILVDSHGDVVHTYAGGSRFLRPSDGPPTHRLLEQLRGELKNAVSAALQACSRNGATSWYRGIRTRLDGEEVLVDVQASPTPRPGTGIMVHVRVREDRPAEAEGEDSAPLDLAAERVHVLEGELRETQQNLQTALEEMETSNEELQATNEELIASNEELQSTNEELNSVNEELYTVNAEHNEKIDELQRLSRDMDYVLSASDVHVLFLDERLRIRKFTSGLQQLLGLVEHDVGRTIDLFASQLVGASWLDSLQNVLDAGRRITHEVIGRDGKLYLLRIAPYQTPRGIDGIVLLLSDLSEVRELESQRERMAAIVEQSPDIVIACRPSGHITDLNASGRALLHGDVPARLDAIVPEARVLYRDALPHALEHGSWHGELVLELGETRIETSAVIVAGVEVPGHERVLSLICRDIGPLKAAQREREEVDRRKDRFLSSLSHELRNPIAALKHAVALLDPDEPKRLREVKAMCERQVETLRRLVDDLLDHSRIATGGIRLEKSRIDLRDVLQTSVETLALLNPAQKLDIDIDDAPLPVAGDSARLQQVLVNLLTNAERYGEGHPIRVTAHQHAGNIEVIVTDQGVGLAPEHLERVFEPFFRVDSDDRQGGVGIGLTLARRIASLHEGELLGESDGPGSGCTFTLRIPTAVDEEATAQAQARPTAEQSGPLEILLVDDNVDSTVALQMLLEINGHTVRIVHTLGEGIDAVRAESPDVVVCDIGLPDGSGEQLARTFASEPDAPRLIALSGWGQESDVRKSLDAGFQVHLTKPVDFDELIRALRP